MANVKHFSDFVIKWESDKYTNNVGDKGGPTKYGITLDTWKHVGYDKNGDKKIDANDVKLLDKNDFMLVLKKNFWDKWKADNIKNQSIAEIVVDWLWASGKWGIIYPQRILGVKDDGIVGNKTIAALNNYPNQEKLFNLIKAARLQFVDNIVKRNPSQKKWINGWKNRINDFKFQK